MCGGGRSGSLLPPGFPGAVWELLVLVWEHDCDDRFAGISGADVDGQSHTPRANASAFDRHPVEFKQAPRTVTPGPAGEPGHENDVPEAAVFVLDCVFPDVCLLGPFHAVRPDGAGDGYGDGEPGVPGGFAYVYQHAVFDGLGAAVAVDQVGVGEKRGVVNLCGPPTANIVRARRKGHINLNVIEKGNLTLLKNNIALIYLEYEAIFKVSRSIFSHSIN